MRQENKTKIDNFARLATPMENNKTKPKYYGSWGKIFDYFFVFACSRLWPQQGLSYLAAQLLVVTTPCHILQIIVFAKVFYVEGEVKVNCGTNNILLSLISLYTNES